MNIYCQIIIKVYKTYYIKTYNKYTIIGKRGERMKIKVLAVDDSDVQLDVLKKYFNDNKEIEIKYLARNGEEAIEIIKSNDVDIMLLDLIMPKLDGFGVLEYIKKNRINISIIVMSAFSKEETIRDVSLLGVKYFALKPFNIECLKSKIISLYNSKVANNELLEIQDKGLQLQVTKILHALGIPSNIKGYQYVRSAILMVYDNPGFIGCITKKLYPNLSVKYHTSIQKVERAIRHAIEVSWDRGDIDLMEDIFGNSVDINRSKPTNSEFIVTIADKLRLDMINV